MSATNSKTCWPELIGKTADEAVKTIKEESGRTSISMHSQSTCSNLGFSKIQVCGPGSRTTRDIDDERVRVYVDEENKVTSQPTIG